MESYRSRIYEKYVSKFKNTRNIFDETTSIKWGLPYDYYFRNWLTFDKGAKILDVACGDGKLLHYYISRGYTCVQGIDISAEQVGIARQVCSSVYEGDVHMFLESNSETFDIISGIDFLEHLHKEEVLILLDSCFNALKPGGRLILQVPNSDSPMFNSIQYSDFTHETQLNPKSLSHLLSITGFVETECRETGPVYNGAGVGSFLRYMAWSVIRASIMLWNIIETGSAGSKILTRVFVISGIKENKS